MSRSWPVASAMAAAAVASFIFATSPAGAQPVGAYSGPPEEVIVTAPRPHVNRFREYGGSFDLPPDRVSLSRNVRYNPRDLLTARGAERLRERVVRAAHRVCRQLGDAYPFERLSTSEPCEREAVSNALVRADEAINAAREDYVYSMMD